MTYSSNNPPKNPSRNTLHTNPSQLRQRAEKKIGTLDFWKSDSMSPEEIQRALYELQVHQIELEMQNEELQRAQTELEASKTRYFELYNLAPVGYFTISEKGLILEANLTAADLLGETRSALIQRPITKFVFKDDQDIFYLHHKSLLEKSEPQTFELRIMKKNGKTFWVKMEASTFRTHSDSGPQNDDTSLFCLVISDITVFKQTEKMLLQSRKMESIGRLSGGLAHEFNNMLQVILGHTELTLQQTDLDEPLAGRIREIQKAAERSAALTGRLLAFACQQVISPKVLDLNETIKEMLNMLHHLVGQNNDLSWKPDDSLWPVRIDPSQIDQVLTNICLNAKDAIIGSGNITIKTGNIFLDEIYCAAHPGSSPGDYVSLSVTDDGCGMNKETLENVFEPFFTTKNSDVRAGMGLATVYGIVKQNSGSIDVSSEYGHRTTFNIFLPRYKGEIARKTKTEERVRGKETILLVEDEQAILKMTAMMLEQLGYKVLCAISSTEAMRLAESNAGAIQLLLTDVILQGMNGKDLAGKLVTLYPQLKVLFMSGYTADILGDLGALNEHINFIQKPFPMQKLSEKTREALDKE